MAVEGAAEAGGHGPIALVTGASRGTGASVARRLAALGATVVVNFRDKQKRADALVAEIAALGGRAEAMRADLTQRIEIGSLFDGIRRRFGRLDLLVLNASGGLERDMPPDYATRINVDAQVASSSLAMPLMPEGGRVVFVTSHLAHFHGIAPGLAAYEPVAASKRAGEDALRALVPELSDRGISLVVVSGDIIEGTVTPTLLERANCGAIEARRAAAGRLPDLEEFAEAITAACFDTSLSSGDTVYVGSTTW